MVKLEDFSRPLSVFYVLFKANFIFNDFSRQSCILKYFSSRANPVVVAILFQHSNQLSFKSVYKHQVHV